MRIVLDTNVLVSAVINPHGKPADILNLVLNGDITACFDDRIIAEYRGVLSRGAFGFDPGDVSALIGFIELYGELVNPAPLSIKLDDPGDLMFYEVLASAGADFLVTGNTRHFKAATDRRIVTPMQFLEKYFSR